ncbi:ABC transporter permease [Pseudonocardia sp. CNS-139]|nr:ABC transporter permease [Pseudonocardia sp. CNS-139]
MEPRPYWREVRRRFFTNRAGVVALAGLGLIVVTSVLAPLLAPYDPLVGVATDRLMPPFSGSHVLGTDEQGRDLLTRLLYGGQLSLLAGFVPTVIATVIGTAIGTWSGYKRGASGTVLMRGMDMLYAFPAILLAIAIGASLGGGLLNSILAVSVVFIPPIARVAESATRQVVVQEYMEAARLSGAGSLRLLRTQVLPNVLNQILVYASGLVGVAMLIAAGLSFLGLGSQPPTPEWGYMLNSMRDTLYSAPVNTMLPGLMIFLTSVAFNTASDALRESMDMRLT